MDGTVVVREKRNVVDKFKSWYKEKMIDTGHSAKMEEGIAEFIDLRADLFMLECVVLSAAITIIAAIPTTGISIALGGAISAAIIAIGPMLKEIGKKYGTKAAIGTKRALEAIFIGENGQSENVEIKDIDITNDAINTGAKVAEHGTNIVNAYQQQKAEEMAKQQAEAQIEPQVEQPTETSSMKM